LFTYSLSYRNLRPNVSVFKEVVHSGDLAL